MPNFNIRNLKKNKVYLHIIDFFVTNISAGKIPYGVPLYTEQEMTEKFNVSRPTLREALRVLEFLDIITVERRNGITVNYPTELHGYNPLLYLMQFDRITDIELFELRQAIETLSAQNAALCRTDEDLQELRSILKAMEDFIAQPEIDSITFSELDFKFHNKVTECSGNKLFSRLLETFSMALQEQLEETIRSQREHLLVLLEHKDIVDCIAKRDSTGAFDKMRQHLINASRSINPSQNPKSIVIPK